MTLQEAVQSAYQIEFDADLTYMSCIDAGINPTDPYDRTRQVDRDYAVCFCLLAKLTGISIVEGGYTLNVKPDDIKNRLYTYIAQWGFSDIANILAGLEGFVDGSVQW